MQGRELESVVLYFSDVDVGTDGSRNQDVESYREAQHCIVKLLE